VKYWYNTNYQAARQTPFQIVYGRVSPSLALFIPGEAIMEAVAQDLLNRDEALKKLKCHLHRAQDQMRKYAKKHRIPSPIQVGIWFFENHTS